MPRFGPPTATCELFTSREGVLAAVTLIVCAVLGSAGAYAYRSYSVRAESMPAPPVITAEKTPTKVVPANDPQSSKTIQDRIGDQGPNERVVSREEQPIELKNLTTVPPSRMRGARRLGGENSWKSKRACDGSTGSTVGSWCGRRRLGTRWAISSGGKPYRSISRTERWPRRCWPARSVCSR